MPVGRSPEVFWWFSEPAGRSAGGTASLSWARRPGRRRDSSLHRPLSATALRYEATYLPGIRVGPDPFHWDRGMRLLVIFPGRRGSRCDGWLDSPQWVLGRQSDEGKR